MGKSCLNCCNVISVPADGDGHGLGGTCTWADHLWPQSTGLKDVEEGIARRNRPCVSTYTMNLDDLVTVQDVFILLRRMSKSLYSQGLAPSATISMRRELRLMSL